jgi:hypothetical protein
VSDKSMLCNGCGRWREDGAVIDLDDGDGLLWTCPDCVQRLTPAVPPPQGASTLPD